MQAYSDTNISPVSNFGSTDGYPGPAPYVPPAGTCCSPWTAAQLYEISFGLNNSGIALPEIHKTLYARNWHRVQRWSTETHQPHPLFFDGVMSECQSSDCAQLDPGVWKQLYPSQDELYCFDYSVEQAWQVHWLETNADPQREQILSESTDIKVAK
jgi:hypothetical protein